MRSVRPIRDRAEPEPSIWRAPLTLAAPAAPLLDIASESGVLAS